MKKNIFTLGLIIWSLSCLAQGSDPRSILVRHDTTFLKAAECEWLIKSHTQNNPAIASEIGKSVPQIILQKIAKGKIKAFDVISGKPIPGNEIYTRGMAVDSVTVHNDAGKAGYKAIQHRRNADNVSMIRIYQDWYFDVATGKFQPVIIAIELVEEVYTSATGMFIGYAPLCRIYY